MVRRLVWRRAALRRSPHPRGDGPDATFSSDILEAFSPPAWGWSGGAVFTNVELKVLPTRVGMVRVIMRHIVIGICSPHPRGDGPVGS